MSECRLRTAREFRQLSQASLSRLTGIHYSTLSRFESGLASPSAEQREKIAQALRFPVFNVFPDAECSEHSQESAHAI